MKASLFCLLAGLCWGASGSCARAEAFDLLSVDQASALSPPSEAPLPERALPVPLSPVPSPAESLPVDPPRVGSGSLKSEPRIVAKPKPGPCDETRSRRAAKTLRVGERVHIEVSGEPDLSKVYVVGTDGRIHFPLVGPVSAAGLSEEGLRRRLKDKLMGGYFVNPIVRVRAGD